MGRVDGKSIIITGAARGMGKAIGHALIKEGAHVCYADIDEDGAKKAAEEAAREETS